MKKLRTSRTSASIKAGCWLIDKGVSYLTVDHSISYYKKSKDDIIGFRLVENGYSPNKLMYRASKGGTIGHRPEGCSSFYIISGSSANAGYTDSFRLTYRTVKGCSYMTKHGSFIYTTIKTMPHTDCKEGIRIVQYRKSSLDSYKLQARSVLGGSIQDITFCGIKKTDYRSAGTKGYLVLSFRLTSYTRRTTPISLKYLFGHKLGKSKVEMPNISRPLASHGVPLYGFRLNRYEKIKRISPYK